MNNLIFENMKNVTVFQGKVNGKIYDNVADYNAAITALIEAGVTDIEATSSTSIKTVKDDEVSNECVTTCTDCDCTCDCDCTNCTCDICDEDVTFYPYMEDEDPFYLDLLVTNDKEANIEAYNEAQRQLEISYRDIVEALYDPETTTDERKEYLEDINDIIANVKHDIADTNAAADKINVRRKNLANEFEKYKQNYEATLREMDAQMDVLNDASRVTSMFKAFYEDVANETMLSIKNNEENVNRNKIETTCNEIKPQNVSDLNSLIDKIFGPGWLNNVK